jgi:hypothetical protein
MPNIPSIKLYLNLVTTLDCLEVRHRMLIHLYQNRLNDYRRVDVGFQGFY